jgi:drug/metabolite transporter (DMT)-like permease
VIGPLASVASSFIWAIASVVFMRLGARNSPEAMNFGKCAIALVLMMLTLAVLQGSPLPQAMSLTGFGWYALSALVGLTIGDTAYFYALTRLGARRALMFSALVPAMTAAFGVAFLGESLTPVMLGGMAMTVAGVTIVIRERTAPAADAPAERPVDAAGIALGVLAALSQATGSVLTRAASGHDEAGALEISIARLAVAVVGIVVVLAVRGRLREIPALFVDRRSTRLIVAGSLLGTYLGVWLMNIGIVYSANVGVAATLNSTSPLFILPVGRIMLGERVTIRALLGAVLAVAGIAVLVLMSS